MNKKLFLNVVLACFATGVYSQVQIQTTLPAAGLVQKNQLWNLVLVNSTEHSITGRIEMVLFDRVTSQELMTATTAEFQLLKGPMSINVNKLNPIQYNYIGMEPDRRMNSLLPVGAYSVCYAFTRIISSEKRESYTEECVAFDVEPLSPPMLLFPTDSMVLDAAPTQFSWTPPAPLALLNRLHYEVFITEVQPAQKAAEAVAENFPFFSTDQPVTNFITYSGAQPAFEKDKWYAWQVIARDNSNYAGQSEVWVFKIAKQEALQQALQGIPYIQLQKNGAEKTIAPDGYLRFFYFNQLADTTVAVTVTDITEKVQARASEFLLPVSRGQNFIQKDISRYVSVREGHVYMLSLQNSAMEKWYVLFEIKK